MKKIAHLLLGRFSIVAVSIILQFFWLVMVMYQFSYQFTYANLAIRVIAIIVVLVIVNRWTNPANKLSWTFIILLSPVLGLLLYMIFGRSGLTKTLSFAFFIRNLPQNPKNRRVFGLNSFILYSKINIERWTCLSL